ncbi:Fe(3+) ions import ATP-binding protein FbpC [Paraliobacillus sp. PM-2]|uniref:ABC transporter ATP-binding protein n=1 Tax=Paraliobacillus sp. PM-2 TaxID=1462524 RepID=UPI00061C61FD|nr:ABC transporter ATP-binding protein [Paraliobacillus sp. PM-2]CQR48338.1 Fe(3+) ions import ATP-binding protein FbpC [Paraliobacillus sp. PM-2]
MYIQIKDLCFTYKKTEKIAVDHFSIDLNKGEILSILGESGSGKSTILRLLAGLEVPSSGSIKVDDLFLFSKSDFVLPEKRGIGMVFQDYALFPHMTVAKNITFGLKKWGRKQVQQRLEEVLDLVNLSDYQKRYPHELSGGQQQRVALARALAPNPVLLLFDEPFSNLDANLQYKIREELRVILKKTGTTSIFVTHDENDARTLADKMVILNEGKMVKSGRPCDMLSPLNEKVHA